jgi:ubiquinone/menaquinone biosynthesis C-methylase UbiE
MSADRDYWEERARRHGTAACGCLNPIEYRYEERLRWDAFQRLVRPQPGWNVLDIGCGVGTWSRRIAGLGANVVGADFSAAMIKMATPTKGVEFMVGSAQDLDLPDGRFDLVLSVTVLQHITADDELRRALANIRRMLKGGGRFFVIEYSPYRLNDQQARASHMRYRTRDEWISVFTVSGFDMVKVTGVRYVGHRVLGGGVARLRRLRRRPDAAGIEDPTLAGPEKALSLLGTGFDLIAARIPGMNSISDLHAFLFVRKP